jgi:hypothetical protein
MLIFIQSHSIREPMVEELYCIQSLNKLDFTIQLPLNAQRNWEKVG